MLIFRGVGVICSIVYIKQDQLTHRNSHQILLRTANFYLRHKSSRIESILASFHHQYPGFWSFGQRKSFKSAIPVEWYKVSWLHQLKLVQVFPLQGFLAASIPIPLLKYELNLWGSPNSAYVHFLRNYGIPLDPKKTHESMKGFKPPPIHGL